MMNFPIVILSHHYQSEGVKQERKKYISCSLKKIHVTVMLLLLLRALVRIIYPTKKRKICVRVL